MIQTAKIKIRDIKELQDEKVVLVQNTITPLKKCKKPKCATTSKKRNLQEHENNISAKTNTITKTATKKLLKSAIKETPKNQKRIDSYFTCCPKTYEIKFPKEEPPTPFGKTKGNSTTITNNNTNTTMRNKKSPPKRHKVGRKRLFIDTTDQLPIVDCITIDSSDTEEEENNETDKSISPTLNIKRTTSKPNIEDNIDSIAASTSKSKQKMIDKNSTTSEQQTISPSNTTTPFGLIMTNSSCSNNLKPHTSTSSSTSTAANFSRRKSKPCPPYKIIENTTFAVDAFQFGYIENITHYFLTHFHADHYIGLTKSFAKPLYMSRITARLLRTFIHVDEQYINEVDLNTPFTINNIEITALDANHCPGAILIVFKFLDTGKCILHTGDFRAWYGMESEPIFWNNDIHTIYLDTTYISDKYAFCTQHESIEKANILIEKCRYKHPDKRVLYICGSYIVGKEKFWSKLAEMHDLKVWAEGNRYKALKAIDDEEFNRFLVEDPLEANMHVIAMGKLKYFDLVDYLKMYEQHYDMIFAIRPSGWEKDTKPSLNGKINIVGIEYSEHSSYAEMQRFVKFLKPQQVLSTVPTGKDLMKTAKVPLNWYKYDKLKPMGSYQPSIDSFMGSKTDLKKSCIRPPNINKGGVENFVSPLKSLKTSPKEINNNLSTAKISTKNRPQQNVVEEQEQQEIFIENSIENLQTNKNINNLQTKTKSTTSKSLNSSTDFENPDLFITMKKNQSSNKKLQKKDTNIIETKDFEKEDINLSNIKNKLKPMNTTITLNTEDYFETPDMLIKQKKPPIIKKEYTPNRNKTNKRNITNTSHQQEDMLPASPTIGTKPVSKLDTPVSQTIRITRSKNVDTSSTVLQNNNAEQPKLTQQNNKIRNSKLQSQTTKTLSKSQENPLLKSTTTTSIDSISSDEMRTIPKYSQLQKSGRKKREIVSDKSSEEMNVLLKPRRSKKQITKTKLDTKAILENILEEVDDMNSLNLTQLACKVVESFSKQNSDNNKDHIPNELLSDEDDENLWQTACNFKQELSTQNETVLATNTQISLQPSTSSAAYHKSTLNESKTKKINTKQKVNKKNITESTNSFQENLLLKSTSPSLDSVSSAELFSSNKYSKNIKNEICTQTTFYQSPDTLNNLTEPLINKNNKRTTFNHNTTPFKKAKTTVDFKFNSKDFLNNILEEKPDIDRFNCSQLAGLVIETRNKHNPDNSKDHIPIDLLSDADDDWM